MSARDASGNPEKSGFRFVTPASRRQSSSTNLLWPAGTPALQTVFGQSRLRYKGFPDALLEEPADREMEIRAAIGKSPAMVWIFASEMDTCIHRFVLKMTTGARVSTSAFSRRYGPIFAYKNPCENKEI